MIHLSITSTELSQISGCQMRLQTSNWTNRRLSLRSQLCTASHINKVIQVVVTCVIQDHLVESLCFIRYSLPLRSQYKGPRGLKGHDSEKRHFSFSWSPCASVGHAEKVTGNTFLHRPPTQSIRVCALLIECMLFPY